jgi:alanine racemase
MHRGAVAFIDLKAVTHNLSVVRAHAPNSAVYAVVKADAYGHGSVAVSKALVAAGANRLAVAFCDEAAPLREAGIKTPVIVLFDPDPDEVFRYNLIPVVSDFRSAERLAKAAEQNGSRLPVHVKIDTGMGRLGIFSEQEKTILAIASLKGITIEGLMSHLAESESADPAFSLGQITRLRELHASLLRKGLIIPYCHLANSGAILNLPDAHFEAVRPGLMLYGYGPAVAVPEMELRPVMTLTTRILALRKVTAGTPISYNRTFITRRESLIGVLAIGYADGYSVGFSNNAEVLVNGKRAPVVGRVCMDLVMVDLTDIEGVTEEDEVMLIGQQGSESITAADLAKRVNTHPYEILTSLGSRALRVYS